MDITVGGDFLRNQLAGDVLSLVAYRLRKLQRATRAVHNRAAAYVAAGGGIFEKKNIEHKI